MREHHPYGEFIHRQPVAMIIGSFPIAKFTDLKRRGEIKSHEVDFFFGGERNLLWRLLAEALNYQLENKADIIQMLEQEGLAIGDVIRSCRRRSGGSSDADLYDICWNDQLLSIIQKHGIKRVYFTSRQVMRWFHRLFPEARLDEILLISPSGQSVRGVVAMPAYKLWKKQHPEGKPLEFIIAFYRQCFGS